MDDNATDDGKFNSLLPACLLLARIAGLPIATIRTFHSDRCAEASRRYNGIHESLASVRAQLIDRLYPAIGNASREERQFLLTVKRACFNHRPLERYCDAAQWPVVMEVGGPLVDDILALEFELAAVVDRFERDYIGTYVEQREQLLGNINDPGFRRGLALASPTVSRKVAGLEGRAGYGPLSQRKLETTLVRYISRAALKLSPFSTFTRVALAAVEQNASPGIRLIGQRPWTERSLLRVKRYLLDQYMAALVLYEPFRRELIVVLNNSLVELPDSRWRFVRPEQWKFDPEGGALRYQWAALSDVQIDGDLVQWLMHELHGGRTTYGRVSELLQNEGELIGSVANIDELIAIGFVNLLPPWSVDEACAERRLLERLSALAPTTALDTVIDCLSQLVYLEEGYASTSTPDHSVEWIGRLVDELWRGLKDVTGLDSGASLNHLSGHEYYEDVLIEGTRRGQAAVPVVQVSLASAEACLRSIEPVLRLSTLFRHNEDFLSTMAACAATQSPARERFGVLELLKTVMPFWQEFARFCLSSSHPGSPWPETFNPMGLAVLRDLQQLRSQVWAGIESCVVEYDDLSEISAEALEALLVGIPPSYAPGAGACLFMQPADEDGRTWVVNNVKEGTGRFASRFTGVMDTATRRHYLDTVATKVRSSASAAGELVDIMCVQGDTGNVHPPQTHRVIEMPGAAVDVARSRRLNLSDLHIRIDADALTARIYDDAGRRIIPVYLGAAHAWYLSPLVRFLAAFGPSELTPIFPPYRRVHVGDCLLSKRMVIGNAILRRRAWSSSVGSLQAHIAGLPEAHAFLAINRWRTAMRIPDQTFIIANASTRTAARNRKPQYVDFTSPLFLRVFASVLLGFRDERITLEEVLPAVSMMPRDSSDIAWAVEVLLDSGMLSC